MSTIFHLRSSPPDVVGRKVDEWSAAAGLMVDPCDNVYSALARALQASANQFCAVVVCVDGLRADEFEFFSLLARHRRSVPVYVYSPKQSSVLIEKAVKAGAVGAVTEEVLQSLAIVRHQPQAEPIRETQPQGEKESEQVANVEPPAPPSAAVSPALGQLNSGGEPLNEATDPESPEPEESAETARVPWLRYDERPIRRKPGDALPMRHGAPSPGVMGGLSPVPDPESTPTESRHSTTPAKRGDESSEPLLTEAELEALLSAEFDDFNVDTAAHDDIEQQERDMLTGNDHPPGGGRR